MERSVYAIISEGEVKNLVVGTFTACNTIAQQQYEDGIAVETWSMYYPAGVQIPVTIGDLYVDGVFTRDGVAITPIPTIDQQTAANTAAICEQSAVLDELIIAITPTGGN